MRGRRRLNTTIVVEAGGTNRSILGHVRNKMQIVLRVAMRTGMHLAMQPR